MEDAPSRKRDGDFTRSGLGLVNGGGELFGFGFYLNFNGSAALNRILWNAGRGYGADAF